MIADDHGIKFELTFTTVDLCFSNKYIDELMRICLIATTPDPQN